MPYSHLTNAVVSGELSEHEQAMLSAPVDVRDGDDAISIELPSEEPQEEVETQLEDSPEVDEQLEETEVETEEGQEEEGEEDPEELEIPDVDPK